MQTMKAQYKTMPMPVSSQFYSAEVFAGLMQRFKETPATDLHQRWLLLEAAHVVGQTHLGSHWRVHGLMLALAWETRAAQEVLGQLFRLALIPLGHLLRRLPMGNSGRANISAFQAMQPSPEILRVIVESRSA
jgi:hypothetical protein